MMWKDVRVYIAGILVVAGLLFGVSYGNDRPSGDSLLSDGEQQIVGKYEDSQGISVEFLKDGTLVFAMGGQQTIWKWTLLDSNRLKLEPTAGIWGVKAAVCDYALDGGDLNITGCEHPLRLRRQ